jgi:hypothetical protein
MDRKRDKHARKYRIQQVRRIKHNIRNDITVGRYQSFGRDFDLKHNMEFLLQDENLPAFLKPQA